MNEYIFTTDEDKNLIYTFASDKLTSRHMKIISLYKTLALHDYNKELNDLPDFLENLYLSSHFDQPVNNLPKTLKKLSIGDFINDRFNQSVNNLPVNLEILQLGTKFNQSVDYLPNSLKILILGTEFNQPINNLPNLLEELTIGYKYNNCYFNQSVDNLPKSLKILLLNLDNKILINKLPYGLENLLLIGKIEMKCNYPPNIKKILFDRKNVKLYDEILMEHSDKIITIQHQKD